MKAFALTALFFLIFSQWLAAQELFINTEPASNMATKSIGFRFTGLGYENSGAFKSIFEQEIMYGASSKIMVHADLFEDNNFSDNYNIRAASLYAKYRFYANDGLRKHFRMAAFARVSDAFLPDQNSEVSIMDDYSGASVGIVATQLLHKVAMSSSLAATDIFPNSGSILNNGHALEYSLSFGYLAMPKIYSNYKQTNMNLMVEFLGKTQWSSQANESQIQESDFLDFAPGVQFIILSRARIDLSWRSQVYGNMQRMWYQSAFVRLEYNIFNT